MRNSLLTDLYRYREREKKQSKEDWLTECLAACLRALPNDVLAEVLSDLTRQSSSTIISLADEIEIITQVVVGRGTAGGTQRPDMLVTVGTRPWLLFENKVSHSVEEGSSENDLETESQLHRYARWLSEQQFDVVGLRPALLFVTHQTPVPSDFIETSSPHPAYHGLDRHCSTWGRVGGLLDAATTHLPDTMHARALVHAYTTYLEEYGMANDYPEYKDLCALGMFVEKAHAFDKLVNGMIERLKDLAPFSGNVRWASAYSDEGTYSSHRYLTPNRLYDGETFVSTGIWFPDRGDGWYADDIEDQMGSPATPSPKVFLQLANSSDDALTKVSGSPGDGWLRLRSDLLAYKDFASFPTEPADRALAIYAWLDVEGAKLKNLLQEQLS